MVAEHSRRPRRALLVLALAVAAMTLVGPRFGAADIQIEDTNWQLRSTDTTLFHRTPTLRFESPELTGTGSCNFLSGEYRLRGRQFVIERLSNTQMSCGHEENRTERDLLQTIASSRRAEVTGRAPARTLTLYTGWTALTFDETPGEDLDTD